MTTVAKLHQTEKLLNLESCERGFRLSVPAVPSTVSFINWTIIEIIN